MSIYATEGCTVMKCVAMLFKRQRRPNTVELKKLCLFVPNFTVGTTSGDSYCPLI